jgi:predicted DNA-binding transcriptional regulator AlpA
MKRGWAPALAAGIRTARLESDRARSLRLQRGSEWRAQPLRTSNSRGPISENESVVRMAIARVFHRRRTNKPSMQQHGHVAQQLWDVRRVAHRLGRSRSWFYANKAALERAGFPSPLPIIRRWDPKAIDEWVAGQDSMGRSVREHRQKNELNAAFGIRKERAFAGPTWIAI